MKQIDGIKIVQVDGLARGNAANGNGGVSSGGGSLAEQAVAAALAYRAQSPIIDGLLKEIGMTGGTLNGLTQAAGLGAGLGAGVGEDTSGAVMKTDGK